MARFTDLPRVLFDLFIGNVQMDLGCMVSRTYHWVTSREASSHSYPQTAKPTTATCILKPVATYMCKALGASGSEGSFRAIVQVSPRTIFQQ